MSDIIDRLLLQSAAFQESSAILNQARSLEDLAKKFFQVLRGNLLVVNASIYYRRSENASWKMIFAKTPESIIPLDDIPSPENNLEIKHIDDETNKLLIFLPLRDKSAFQICLGSKLDKSSYREFDTVCLQIYLQQLDNAYRFYISRQKEKELIFELNHRVLQLNSLIDTGIELSRLQEGDQLLRLALERVLALTNASKGLLRINSGPKVIHKEYFPNHFKSRELEKSSYKISTVFTFNDKKYSFFLFEKESRKGRVEFDATDQLLLDAFARQVLASLENHYLYEQSLEKERIDSEISLAGAIQKRLIPEKLPVIDGYDHFAVNIPTKFIGGDYYDCIALDDGRYVFIMADVSGKGVAAGLLVSTLQASAHAYVDGPFELELLVHKLNEVVHNAATLEKYITAVFAVLDPKTGELITVNAGHNPTYLLRNNKSIEELRTGGIPLGMMKTAHYESAHTFLNTGDSILFYTDGVTEAMNEQDEEYDDVHPIKEFLVKNNALTAEEFINTLLHDLDEFTGDTDQSDDITALFLKNAGTT